MKKFHVLFIVLVFGSLLAACSASTANITSADLGTGFDSSTNKVTGATTTFGKTEPALHCVVAVANAPDGTTVRVVWTAVAAVDASGNAVKDTKVNETTTTLTSDGVVNASLNIPSTGAWPTGSYKADIYLNDKLDRTLTFTVQ
jgi:hypothetical protein